MKKFDNQRLISNLEVILNKNIEKLTDEDLNKIEFLNFSKQNDVGEQEYLIKEMLVFKNLKNLTIEKSIITISDLQTLGHLDNLETINFINCIFESKSQNYLKFIKNIKNLSFKGCYIDDYSNMFNIPQISFLEIKFPYNDVTIDIHNFVNMVNLNILLLEGCIISNESELKSFNNLEILSLLSTEIENLNFINLIPNLKKLYISNKYIDYSKINNSNIKIFDSYIDMLMDDENYSKGIV